MSAWRDAIASNLADRHEQHRGPTAEEEVPADFVRYLDATRATDFFGEIKRRSYALLDLHPGDEVCDRGCGTGDDVLALAGLLGPGGRPTCVGG